MTIRPTPPKANPGDPPWEVIVGDNLRRLRKAKRMTQVQLAEASGLDLRYLGSIERGAGNPTVAVLGKLAGAMGVHPGEFLYESVQVGDPSER